MSTTQAAAAAGLGPAPEWLGAEARREWERIATLVAPDVDLTIVTTYCTETGRHAEISRAMAAWEAWDGSDRDVLREFLAVCRRQLGRTGKIDTAEWPEIVRDLRKAAAAAQSAAGKLAPQVLAVRPLAGTSGAPPLLTRRELSAALGVAMMTVIGWERQGLVPAQRGRRGVPSYYVEADVRAWRQAREDAAQPVGAAAAEGRLDALHERARKDHWAAQVTEQSYRAKARELLPRLEVEKAWSAERDAVRTKILASYTTAADAVHRAAVLQGVAGVERALKDVAYEILRELAAGGTAAPKVARARKARKKSRKDSPLRRRRLLAAEATP